MEYRRCQTAEADINGAFICVGCLHGGSCLYIVARRQDRHAGDGAHQRKILAALVARAVFTDGDAAVRRRDFHVQVRVAHGVADLLKGSARGKHRKAAGKGNEAHRG